MSEAPPSPDLDRLIEELRARANALHSSPGGPRETARLCSGAADNLEALLSRLQASEAERDEWRDAAERVYEDCERQTNRAQTAEAKLTASEARERELLEALRETRTDLVILQGNVASAARSDPRWGGMTEEVRSWVARIDAALLKKEG